MPDDAIRLLIADDHAVVRRGLRLFLDLQPDLEVVAEAGDGGEAVAAVDAHRPDVVLMDLAMPRVDGVEATRALREREPGARVLVLSSFFDEERVLRALRAGAAGYLLKDAEPERLADAVRAVHRGEPVLCDEAIACLLARLRGRGERPEGTVTVLFTDIEGSTAILESLGDAGARELFRRHDCLVREVVVQGGGVEVEKEGDAFMVAFSGARKAIHCAVALQQRLARECDLRVRMGLNTGDVIAEEERYFGRTVFIASRIASLAAGGEILASETTRMLAGDEDLTFRERGEQELKGLKGRHRVFEVEWKRTPSPS